MQGFRETGLGGPVALGATTLEICGIQYATGVQAQCTHMRGLPSLQSPISISNEGMVPRTGSCPRVRGTAAAQADYTARIRFIPACAGNRSCALFSSSL